MKWFKITWTFLLALVTAQVSLQAAGNKLEIGAPAPDVLSTSGAGAVMSSLVPSALTCTVINANKNANAILLNFMYLPFYYICFNQVWFSLLVFT